MRCSKCLLPSSLPNSKFNEAGECWWCQTSFPPYFPKGPDKLRELLNSIKSSQSGADCLVGVSGGKDSSYVLAELKNTFGMRVEAFTYSHFGLASFAMDNAKRVCESLGVRHHVISLPNDEHLKSFQSFFKVWLSSAHPIPAALTCVACKHLHSMGNRLAVKRNIPMLVWSNCPLEIPPFLPLRLNSTTRQQFKRDGMIKGATRLGREMLATKGLASGVFKHFSTCMTGCLSVTPTSKYLKFRYPSKKQIFFFNFCDWNPSIMIKKLTEETGWKKPEDMPDDWHSDCLFNIFKEYMFQKMYGISYTDAFLSNQIRYGLITREKAWDLLKKSKEYYSKQLLTALDIVGLGNMASKIDSSCFNITE